MKDARRMAFGMAALIALAGVSGCNGPAAGPCPRDAELVARFESRAADFAALEKTPENAEWIARLGMQRAVRRAAQPALVWYVTWYQDFPGPGGCMKGYAWSEAEPASLVEDLDANTQPGSPGTVELYRRIKGNWYLFYQSSD